MSALLPDLHGTRDGAHRGGTGAVGSVIVRACRNAIGLATLAGSVALLLIPAAHAGRNDGGPSAGAVGAAMNETLWLLHEQQLAIQRNTHYLQQRKHFNKMLLGDQPATGDGTQPAGPSAQAVRHNRQALAHVEHNISLSRAHLLAKLPPGVKRVQSLLGALERLGSKDRRIAAFVLFAARRQQSALDQLRDILNQEDASLILPGPGPKPRLRRS
jgi:hypothetical protein